MIDTTCPACGALYSPSCTVCALTRPVERAIYWGRPSQTLVHTVIKGIDEEDRALAFARGSYQRSLVEGNETLGGSTLRGKAKQWSLKYRRSADALVERLRKAGIGYVIELGPRGGFSSSRLTFPDRSAVVPAEHAHRHALPIIR